MVWTIKKDKEPEAIFVTTMKRENESNKNIGVYLSL